MSSLDILTWAFGLRGIKPIEKLVAIYFAARAGSSEGGLAELEIDIVDLGAWCGCKKEEAYHTILELEKFGWQIVETEPFRKLRVTLQLSTEGPVRQEPVIGTLTLYVIATDHGVKIGITRDLSSRLMNLAGSSPLPIRVCLKASGPRPAIAYVEKCCHAELAPQRIRGEWFSCGVEKAMEVARDWLRKVGVEPDDQ